MTSNGNAGNLSGAGVRANYTPQVGQPLYTKTYGQFFNPLLFSRPLDNALGNTGRNQFRGPGINNWNISVFKNILFNESTRIQLRLETFNTFNHTQFATLFNSITVNDGPGYPVSASNRSNSGGVSGTYDSRNIQLGGKFYF